jgi:hypothetical protein
MALANFWLDKSKNRKCEYRPLSTKEVEVIEPHKVKPKKNGSKSDLSVCKKSGEVVIHPKTKHYDKDGNLVYPGDTNYQPVDININEPPWKERLQTMIEENGTKAVIEFRVMDFDQKPSVVLGDLGLTACEFWEKGQSRTAKSQVVYEENGFSIAADRRYRTIEDRISRLIDKMYILKERLRQVCENYSAELSCVFYVAGDDIPPIHFSETALSRLAEMRAEIDIDLYFTG